ncbi:MAG TPA: SUF system NifU family Fe-S cluster assembly protein [Gemmatimonadales bacterium]|nr:SUF system NifU family Fe-S cluster assembly protein [Gemmatimonadales bacterium]
MCPPESPPGPRSPAPPSPATLPDLGELYQELILDHYRRPRNKGKLEQPTHGAALNNPLCGDEVDLELRVQNDVITDVRFVGRGCSISQAAASMMTQVIKDRPLTEALSLAGRMSAMMHGDEAAARDKSLGDLRALVGVARFPVRVKCALLPWNALQDALKSSGTASR